MGADEEFLNHVMDLLAPLDGISNRAMFGGFGIFQEGDMFASNNLRLEPTIVV